MSTEEMNTFKVPPHSVEAEQSVLGGLLLENNAFDIVAPILSEADFYRYDHRLLFRHIRKLILDGHPADVITVSESLERKNELKTVGGLPYVASLAQNTPSAANIRRYAEIVRERTVMRQMIEIATGILDAAYNMGQRSVQDVISDAERAIFKIAEAQLDARGGFADMAQVVTRMMAEYERATQCEDGITGLRTGLRDLDEATGGLQDGELIFVAGRPSMGKTAFAMSLVESIAVKQSLPVGVFSMEMGSLSLGQRLLAALAGIDFRRWRRGRSYDEEFDRAGPALATLAAAPVFICEEKAVTASHLRSLVRRKHRESGGFRAVVVDYIQLMSGDDSDRPENRNLEIAGISRALKLLAQEIEAPVIVLAQLNRSLESRPNKRPILADLRDSGGLEQDADVVLFLYRHSIYDPEFPDKSLVEIIIGKQRNDAIGTVKANFFADQQRFRDRTPEEVI